MALISSHAMYASDRRRIAAFWVSRLDAMFAAESLQLQPWIGRLRGQRRHARPRRMERHRPFASAEELVGGVWSWLTERRWSPTERAFFFTHTGGGNEIGNVFRTGKRRGRRYLLLLLSRIRCGAPTRNTSMEPLD